MRQRTAGRKYWATLGVAGLLALYWVLAVSTSSRVGVTADEPVHLAGGYSYWRFNDYRLQPENGTLAMRLAALPLLPMRLNWVPADDPEWRHSIVNHVAYQFLFRLGNPRDQMLLAARAMIALLGVFTLWLIWTWARHLFGRTAGWLALTLAVFSPTLLAHGGLATSDMAITACLLAAVTAFWRLLHVVSWPRLLIASLAGGAVLLAKMSGVLAAPMLVLLLVVRWMQPTPLVVRLTATKHWLRRRGAVIATTSALTVAVAAGSIALLWTGYGFRFSAFAPRQAPGAQLYFSWAEILDEKPISDDWPGGARSVLSPLPSAPSPTPITAVIRWTRDHRLLPEAYLWGLAHTYKFSRQRPAFLNGDFRLTGWPQFFPWTFWLKTALPVLVLFAAGMVAIAIPPGRRRKGRIWYRSSPLLALFVVYWAVALRTNLNIGHRHILPTYPVVFVFAGAAACWLRSRARRTIAIGLILTVAAHAADSFAARPFYLSYFQPLAGGSANGWRHLIDSSYDWGQGLPDLTRWLEQRKTAGDSTPVYLTYFGADSPRDRDLPVIRFGDEIDDIGPRGFPVRPSGGWFAISATHFQRVYLHMAGPWTPNLEQLYQKYRIELSRSGLPTTDEKERAKVLRATMDFEELEFGRLCHFLRNRPPDRILGASILLFHLTDAEVALALQSPLPIIDRVTDTSHAAR